MPTEEATKSSFRNWVSSDIKIFAEINADKKVMEFFPDTITLEHTIEFVERMQNQFNEKGFCYFAVDKLATQELIGFIGLSEQTFEADFTPCIDIGWRLNRSEWNNGYAVEGAKKCLAFAFKELGLKHVYAIAPAINVKSELIMKKIGMKKIKNFQHPRLMNHVTLQDCVLYCVNCLSDGATVDLRAHVIRAPPRWFLHATRALSASARQRLLRR